MHRTLKILFLLGIANLIFGKTANTQTFTSPSDSISKNGFIIPKNLKESTIELDKVFTIKAKEKLKALPEDTIKYVFDIFIINEWLRPTNSRLKTYLKQAGLNDDYEMEYFITLALYNYLTTGSYDISAKLERYREINDSIYLIRSNECAKMQLLDSIDGQYIPKDLIDCYHFLDKIICDSSRNKIKTSSDMFEYYFSIGLWIRNNLGLWTCSRLSKYFKDNGIKHPDDMSGLILEGYRWYLNDNIYGVQELLTKIPPIPPPSEVVQTGKYKDPYRQQLNKFRRHRKIDGFDISTITFIK